MDPRLGLTVPVMPFDVRESCDIAAHAESLGYTDAWAAEASGTDGFSVASAIGVATQSMRIGIAIVPIYTRPPALLAMSSLAAHEATSGRFCLGLGASSPVIVERWMGQSFEKPVTRMRETIEVVKAALTGDKVNFEGDTVKVRGFRLEGAAKSPVPIFIAALGPKMLELAEEVADGVALFLTSEEGVRLTKKSAASCETVARLICFIDEDPAEVRPFARWLIAPYLAVPGYNRFVAAQGFEDVARAVSENWSAGDRQGALDAITDEVVDALTISGPAGACKERIDSFRDAGLDTPILMLLSQKGPEALRSAIEAMAP